MRKFFIHLATLALVMCMGVGAASAFSQDSLVWKKCTDCHEGAGSKIARISDIRTTPEEWTVIVDRMRRLHGMDLTADEMGTLLKELCATQLLTPEEADKVGYLDLFNNSQHFEAPANADEEAMFAACVRCHSAGKILSYRMTDDEWSKIRDFHLYIDPAIMFQMREMHWRAEADKVLSYLSKAAAFDKAWTAPKASPAGEWVVLGYEPGKGTYRGSATLKADGDAEFKMEGELSFSDGTSETFSGSATMYGGYALRTRARQNGKYTMGAFNFVDGVISGAHHHMAPDFRTSTSTWYSQKGKSLALRVTPGFLLTGEDTKIVIEGMNLPKISAGDISISGGNVEVLWAKSIGSDAVEALVAYRGTGYGSAEVSVKGLKAGSVKLAPRIDYLTVTPHTGRARVNGGVNYPAEGVQYETFAHSNGADVSDPSDDFLLGPVDAHYRLVELETRPGDDELALLGEIEPDGTYLPNATYNPIPSREYGGEATGLVKVVVEYARGKSHYMADAQLVVTVPDYIQRIR